MTSLLHTRLKIIRVIIKLPNSEQSSKGKVKTRKYINRLNQSTIYINHRRGYRISSYGGALKKIKHFGYFVWKITILRIKIKFSSNFRGGARRVRTPAPWIRAWISTIRSCKVKTNRQYNDDLQTYTENIKRSRDKLW